MREVAIVSPVRTPWQFGGTLKDIPAEDSAPDSQGSRVRSGWDPGDDEVVLGHGYSSGVNPAHRTPVRQ